MRTDCMRFMRNKHTHLRLEKLRQVDLNLLITFAAIADEKNITAAGSRLLLSPPAVSRALQRARAMFQYDLLVRSPSGFELTLQGHKILNELEGLLPKMEHLVAPAAFDPERRRATSALLVPTTFAQSWCRIYAFMPAICERAPPSAF
jgi:DNA-binding transcriptional LysR family regulator